MWLGECSLPCAFLGLQLDSIVRILTGKYRVRYCLVWYVQVIVEDVEVEGNLFRRLVFGSSRSLIQSDVKLVDEKPNKSKFLFEQITAQISLIHLYLYLLLAV